MPGVSVVPISRTSIVRTIASRGRWLASCFQWSRLFLAVSALWGVRGLVDTKNKLENNRPIANFEEVKQVLP